MKRERALPNVLSRLLGDSGADEDAGQTSLRRYREEVIRDLRWLLATPARPPESEFADFPQVEASVLNYGLRGMAGVSASQVDGNDIAEMLRNSIQRFESRIDGSSLTVRTAKESRFDEYESLAFEIEAELRVNDTVESLFLRTELDIVEGEWKFE